MAVTVIAGGELSAAPLAGPVMLTVGGVVTAIVTGADDVVPPWLSVATATSVAVPEEDGVQLKLYGLVESVATVVPLTCSATDTTEPSLSLAVAETGTTMPVTAVAPLAGAVIPTLGGLFGRTTLTVIGAEVVSAAKSSPAIAVSV